MPFASLIQNSFNTGEFSPVALGRTDFPKYKSGLSLMQRFIPLVQGGATRTPGTLHVNPAKVLGGAEGRTRLLPFKFSNGDAFIIEMGDQYLRFFRNRAPVYLTAQAITGITKANPAVVTYVGADPVSGVEVNLRGVVGMTQVNNTRFRIANVNNGANTFELQDTFGNNVDSTAFTTYSSGGFFEQVYEIVSPYLLADIDDLRVFQSFDVIYIAHPSYAPRKLSRSAITTWAFSSVVFSDGPYLPINSGASTLTPAATTGAGINVTASAITDINGGIGWQTTDVGRLIRIKHTTTWGWAIITARTSTTVVVVTIMSAFGATTASAVWRLGEFSDTTGYPSVLFSFEDRVGYGASPAAPQTLNLSKTGDYDNFAPTATDSSIAADNALQFRLNSGQADPIRWVAVDEKGLVIGTTGAEWIIRSSLTNEAMSAINFPSAKSSTNHGSANIDVLNIGKAHLFVQTSKRKLREMTYAYQIDGFQTIDTTVLAEHITESGIKRMAYQQEPFHLIWTQRVDGALRALTYDKEQDVAGWHRQPLGGFSDVGQTLDVIVESIACIPSPDGTQDDFWISSKRYINGKTRRHIEYLGAFSTNYTSPSVCYFVDDGIQVDMGSSQTVIPGFKHLIGQTVSLLVDGAVQPNQVVAADGTVTLTRAGQLVCGGLKYLSRLQTLRPEGGSANGTSMGKTKRIHKLFALLHQTVGLRVGHSFDTATYTMDRQQFRDGSDLMGVAVPLFSGIKKLEASFDYDSDAYVCLEQDQPLPCTVLALMPQLKTEDAQ